MKKILMMIVSAALFAVLFSSCKDDKKDGDGDKPKDYSGYEYSQLSPEKQKEKLAADAKAVIEKLNGLSDASAIELLLSFGELSENFPLLGGEDEDEYYPEEEYEIWGAPRKAAEAAEDLIYIKDFYGKFTWNSKTGKWDESASANKLIIVLPAKRGETTNNGQIEISAESSGEFADGIELPKSLKISLLIGGKSVGSIEVKGGSVSNSSAPKSASIKMTLDDYALEYSFNKGNKSTTSIKFSKGSETLLYGVADLTADVDNLIEKEDVNYIENGNFELKLNDKVAFAGSVDYKNIAKLDENALGAEKYAEEMNKYVKLYLVSLSDKTKIADIKFSGIEEGPELVFGDKSHATIDAFFGEGFDTVIDAWEKFINKMDKF